MTREKISEAVGNIADRYIEEADEITVLGAEQQIGREAMPETEQITVQEATGQTASMTEQGIMPETKQMAEQKQTQEKKAGKRPLRKWLPMAACLCLVVAGISGFAVFKIAHPWPVEIDFYSINSGETVQYGGEVAILPRWEDREIYDQYGSVRWNGMSYDARGAELPSDRIGEFLGNVIARGTDFYAKDGEGERTISAEVYAVTKLSTECLIAVRYEGTDVWYPCTNWRYKPETLGQFLEDLNLWEEIELGGIHYSYTGALGSHVNVVFDDVEDEIIKDWLFTEAASKEVSDTFGPFEEPRELMGISVDIPLWGVENIALHICEEGYIWTNIFSTAKLFYIGEDKTEGFMEYLKEECEGREMIHIRVPAVEELFPAKPEDESVETSAASPSRAPAK